MRKRIFAGRENGAPALDWQAQGRAKVARGAGRIGANEAKT